MPKTPKWIKSMCEKEEITIRKSGWQWREDMVEITVSKWHLNDRNKIHEGVHVILSDDIDFNEIVDVLRVRCDERLLDVK